jgi:hypothetical protein
MRGGKPFSRGNLYLLLSNPIYVGRVSHRGTIYPGQHEAIIDDRTWEDVQTKLRGNAAPRRSKSNTPSPTLLTGLLFDDRGDLLCPTHAVKRGRRYRYYVSKRIAHGCQKDQTAWRLPAAEIDGVVRGLIIALLSDPRECGRAIGVTIEVPDIEPITKLIRDGDLNAQRTILQAIIDRIDLAAAEIAISIKRSALIRQLGCGNLDASAETIFRYVRPIALRRRGVERKVVLCNGDPGTAEPDPMLCKMIGRAHLWHKQLARHDVSSVEAIALREVMDGSDVSRILQLAFLAPDIVEAILAGRQPHELTARALMRMGPLPSGWQAQRQRLGFAH